MLSPANKSETPEVRGKHTNSIPLSSYLHDMLNGFHAWFYLIVTGNELPGIEVSKNVSAKFGDKIVLSCNLTISQAASADQTKLTKLMWAKDGGLIEEVLYPREQSLKSLKIDVDRPEVGGIYTCHLTSKLRNVKEYNVTDNIYVSGKNYIKCF